MALVPIPGDIATSSESVEGFEISIPAKRNLFVVVFLTFWLVGWLFGEGAALFQLMKSDTPQAPIAFLATWLGMWTIGGGVALYLWAWMLFGHERIVLGASSLAVGRHILGLTFSKEYDLAAVRNLAPTIFGPARFGAGNSNLFTGIAGGALQFDYGSKTIRFGAALQEAEAKKLCGQLIKRRPALGSGRGA